MKIQNRLLLVWIAGQITGMFAIVGDEIQGLPWDAKYNFPVIGALPKFGGYLRLGAWDLVFGVLFLSIIVGAKLMLDGMGQAKQS